MTSKHLPLRGDAPTRSKVPRFKSYRAHKPQLREDFRRRCGYCNGPDAHFGGPTGSHIDHFAPKSKFPDLGSSYENLVYSCPFCNRAKADKWVGDDPTIPNNGTVGFIDPCGPELDRHLGRSSKGAIIELTPLGHYIVENLNLRLARHQFIWQVDRIKSLACELLRLRDRLAVNSHRYNELANAIADLFAEYLQYLPVIHDP